MRLYDAHSVRGVRTLLRALPALAVLVLFLPSKAQSTALPACSPDNAVGPPTCSMVRMLKEFYEREMMKNPLPLPPRYDGGLTPRYREKKP